MTSKMRFRNDGAFQIYMASINCTFSKNSILNYHMFYHDQTFYRHLLLVTKYVFTYNDKIEHVEQVTYTNVTFEFYTMT
jgi:hypothetical protein